MGKYQTRRQALYTLDLGNTIKTRVPTDVVVTQLELISLKPNLLHPSNQKSTSDVLTLSLLPYLKLKLPSSTRDAYSTRVIRNFTSLTNMSLGLAARLSLRTSRITPHQGLSVSSSHRHLFRASTATITTANPGPINPRRSLTSSTPKLQSKLNAEPEAMSVYKEFQAGNEEYRKTFGDKGNLAIPPKRKLIILTCMDSRINPPQQMGLHEGDAHIIRNAGGVAKDALRSIIISQRLLGTREIAVFHHTDCGMVKFTTPQLRDILKDEAALGHSPSDSDSTSSATGNDSGPGSGDSGSKDVATASQSAAAAAAQSYKDAVARAADSMEFLEFTDEEEAVREDVKFLEENPLVLRGTKVTGWLYHPRTGKIDQIV